MKDNVDDGDAFSLSRLSAEKKRCWNRVLLGDSRKDVPKDLDLLVPQVSRFEWLNATHR